MMPDGEFPPCFFKKPLIDSVEPAENKEDACYEYAPLVIDNCSNNPKWL